MAQRQCNAPRVPAVAGAAVVAVVAAVAVIAVVDAGADVRRAPKTVILAVFC